MLPAVRGPVDAARPLHGEEDAGAPAVELQVYKPVSRGEVGVVGRVVVGPVILRRQLPDPGLAAVRGLENPRFGRPGRGMERIHAVGQDVRRRHIDHTCIRGIHLKSAHGQIPEIPPAAIGREGLPVPAAVRGLEDAHPEKARLRVRLPGSGIDHIGVRGGEADDLDGQGGHAVGHGPEVGAAVLRDPDSALSRPQEYGVRIPRGLGPRPAPCRCRSCRRCPAWSHSEWGPGPGIPRPATHPPERGTGRPAPWPQPGAAWERFGQGVPAGPETTSPAPPGPRRPPVCSQPCPQAQPPPPETLLPPPAPRRTNSSHPKRHTQDDAVSRCPPPSRRKSPRRTSVWKAQSFSNILFPFMKSTEGIAFFDPNHPSASKTHMPIPGFPPPPPGASRIY